MALQEFGTEGNGTSRSRVERVFKRLRLCMVAEHTVAALSGGQKDATSTVRLN